MNKRKVMIIISAALIVFIVCFSINKIRATEPVDEFDIPKSILLNELTSFDEDEVSKVGLLRLGPVWIVEGKAFTAEKNPCFTPIDAHVSWRVDLSVLKPCGRSGKTFFFSYTGKAERDVIIALSGNEYTLLTSGDVLVPYKYKSEDFSVVYQSNENVADYIDELWESHLKEEHPLHYVLIDGEIEHVTLSLKSHPELQYPLSHCLYGDEFCSALPYNKDKTGK